MFSRPKFVKLADCLLEKLKAEISSHEHPYKIDISRDVKILYEHSLGSGSFANVFKCKFLGVLAAAKVFHTNCIDMQAMEKEAKLFSELRHPNVLQFIGYGVKGCQSVIVSELMSKDLRTYLDAKKKNAGQGPPLPLLVAINIMLQVAEAMNYLHEMGVIHRDLKAKNVLINVLEDQDGRLSSTSVQTKLADFGESKSKLHDSRFTTRPVGPSPQIFFMHFDVTGKGHSHPELGHSQPEFFLYRVNDYGSIHGKGSVSRRGMSEDWKLSYGVSTLNVREVSIKDFDGNMFTSINGQVIGYFGLLDQHINASNLAKQLRTQLFTDLLNYPQSFYDPKVPIVQIYNKIDQDYWGKENIQHHAARSKASICVLVGNHLVVANVGDSRAVICAHGEAIALSTDQASYRAPTNIEGDVVRYNYWTDAVSMVESIPDAENAANRLVEEACHRGSLDDVTCVVVRFHHNA
ncbi:unnamed protein product [Sphagnum jensenii]|uniref:Protein kinase domain-containing protein n=1 Tax=Sphagnum jensenii TaxID=128206 RepID=A0ABP0WWN3_9BRYO